MANEYTNDGSGTSHVSGEGSDATVELNIKTLDSQIYSFRVDKNMPVAIFKEKIANEIGVPVGQQRLIFRGRVLKDEHLLSEYHMASIGSSLTKSGTDHDTIQSPLSLSNTLLDEVEDGHTLHLVARQPVQPQAPANTSSGDTNGNTSIRGNDASAGGPRNRIGQISHSVVLGTFNVGGEQGEGMVPDLSRVIGAVLNSFGAGGQVATNSTGGLQSSNMPNFTGQAFQGNEVGGSHGNIGGQNPAGNQTEGRQAFSGQPFQPSPQVVHVPLTAAIPVPSLLSPIPDSLNTLCEFMMHMERVLVLNGNSQSIRSVSAEQSTEQPPRVELPSNERGLPTPEALSIVLQRAEQLLSGPTTTSLSHIAGRLQREGSSTDPATRGQIQTESVQVGLAMQHLGALLLELGRTILTLRMGQSPAESSVNAGPAVYISPSGPNPLMVQPFPLQTNSLFSGPVPPSNHMALGPVGIGNAPRHVNIHIHAGTSLAPAIATMGARTNATGMQGVQDNAAGLGASVPSPTAGVAIAAQPGPGLSFSQPPPDSIRLGSIVNEINSQLRQFGGNSQVESQHVSGNAGSGASIPHTIRSLENEIHSQLRQFAGNRQGGNQPVSDSTGSGASNAQNVHPNSTVLHGAGESGLDLKTQDEHAQVHENEEEENSLSSKDTVSSSVDIPSSSVDLSSSPAGCPNVETSLKSEDTSQTTSSSISKNNDPDCAQAVPLGLGLGSLDRKKRTKQPKSVSGSIDSGATDPHPNRNLNAGISGLQLLQSLAARSSGTTRSVANDTPSDKEVPLVGQVIEGGSPRDLSSDDRSDAGSVVSQVLHSPVMNNLLAGVSEQTGIGSPNVFRNMLQQLTQNSQIMNSVSQIAQQVDNRDLGNMFSGLGSGQGGGFNLAGMVRQMMPVVSQVLGQGSLTPHPFPTPVAEHQNQRNERESSGAEDPNDRNIEIDLEEVAHRIEQFRAPADVFQAIAGNAARLNGNGSNAEDILLALDNNEDLANDYIEMLQRDLQRRLQDDYMKDSF